MPFVVAVLASLALIAGTDEPAAQGCVGAEEAVVVATAIEGADTAVIRGRLTRPPGWREDEDGEPIPTFRAGRVEITD